MYRKTINFIGKHNREIVILFYVTLILRFIWSCLRETAGGCGTIEYICFWLTGILAILILTSSFFLLFIDHIRLDRILSGGKLTNILFIIAGILSVPFTANFIISFIYHDVYRFASEMLSEPAPGQEPSLLWTIFYHFVDPGNQHMAVTHRAKIWTLAISMSGAILMGGVLISCITNLFDRRGDNFISGRCRYPYNFLSKPSFGKFVIIIGGHDMVAGLCKDILKKDDNIDNIFILTNSDVELLRSNIRSKLEDKEERIVIYYGNRGNTEELDALHPEHAEEIHILGESCSEPLHDQLNMKCVNWLAERLKEKHVTEIKKCHVLFEYQSTFAAFQSSSIRSILNGVLEFLPFNYYETWAQKVISEYTPVEGNGQKYDSCGTVHIFIVGMSRMGVAMGLEYAHASHFPNFVRDNSLRTRISFIDTNAAVEKDFLMGRYRNLFDLSRWRYIEENDTDPSWNIPDRDFLDIEWEFLNGGVQTPYICEYIKKCVSDNDRHVTMAVCLPDSSQSLASALYLPECMYSKENVIQILVYQNKESSIIDGINGSDMKYQKLRAFGTAPDTFDSGLIINDTKPVLVGGIYDTLYEMISKKESYENLYEKIRSSYVEKGYSGWKTCKVWAKWSNIYNSCTIASKLRSCDITPDEFDILRKNISLKKGKMIPDENAIGNTLMCKFNNMAAVEHNRWNIEKLLMGYRALTDDELSRFSPEMDTAEFDRLKDSLKNKVYRAHLDIQPFDLLHTIDKGIEDYDYVLSLMIPDILRDSAALTLGDKQTSQH